MENGRGEDERFWGFSWGFCVFLSWERLRWWRKQNHENFIGGRVCVYGMRDLMKVERISFTGGFCVIL